VVGGLPGVHRLYDTTELNLGERGGDLVATCRPGWRFSDPTPFSNPIPGNHGHEVTLGIPFFIGGWHRIVRRGAVVDLPTRTVHITPTVTRLFGLAHDEIDGTAATEAFHLRVVAPGSGLRGRGGLPVRTPGRGPGATLGRLGVDT